jgi:DNA-binding NarL/FixJ family response regulator
VAEPVRVFVIDDHPAVREGLRAFVEARPGLEWAGDSDGSGDLVAEALAARSGVVVMDLVLPGIEGAEAIAELVSRAPDLPVLVLTSFGSQDRVIAALRAGARGYLLKDAGPAELARAIVAVAAGDGALDPKVTSAVIGAAASARAPLDDLTAREREVLDLLGAGLTNREISRRLVISEKTVKHHVSAVLRKLGVPDRTQAALLAVRAGLGRGGGGA